MEITRHSINIARSNRFDTCALIRHGHFPKSKSRVQNATAGGRIMKFPNVCPGVVSIVLQRYNISEVIIYVYYLHTNNFRQTICLL